MGLLARDLPRLEPSWSVEVLVAQARRAAYRREHWGSAVVQRAGTLACVASTPVAPSFGRLLRRLDADLLHFHFPYPWGEAAAVLGGVRVPYVVTYHMDIVRQRLLGALYRPIASRFLAGAARIITFSPQLREHSAALGLFRDKTEVIPGGVDIAHWSAPRPAESAALRALWSRGKPLILFVGRMVYYKGLEHLLRAMLQLDATLVLVGTGPLRASLEQLARELGVRERVVFAGALKEDEQLAAAYQAADVFVLPSDRSAEAFSFAMVQAHAAGLPAVSTRLPTGVVEVNRDGVTGLVVPPGDAAALASALDRLLRDPALRRRLAEGARTLAAERFEARACAARVSQLYRDVLCRGITPARPASVVPAPGLSGV
jgi:glycosyltransferase involved in cell wall biosynthesis